MRPRYEDFVFDIDGTLLDTERTGVLSLMQTIRELTGVDLPYEEAYVFFGVPSSKAASTLGYADAARFADVWERHFQELMYLVQPFPGVVDVLKDLRACGARMGIVTSRSRPEIQYDPHLARLLPYFDALVCSEDSLRHKPFPDPRRRRSTWATRRTTGTAATMRAVTSPWPTGRDAIRRTSGRNTVSRMPTRFVKFWESERYRMPPRSRIRLSRRFFSLPKVDFKYLAHWSGVKTFSSASSVAAIHLSEMT